MKILRNIILLLSIIISIYACGNKETKETVQLPELNQMSDLIVSAEISNISNGFIITGQCNYPEGTKLSFTTYINDEISAQGNAIVNKGVFEIEFGSKVLKSNVFEVACIINNFWQSENVLEKFNSLEVKEENIVNNFNLELMKKEYFSKIIGIDADFKPLLNNVESLKNFPYMNVKRINMNLIVDKDLTDQEFAQELKYKIFEIMLKEPDAHMALVRCFKPNEDILFKKALFSPTGDWANIEDKKPFKDYSLIIQ